MPPRELNPKDTMLVMEMIKTFQAAYRSTPQSTSDFIVGMTGVLKIFKVERRPLPYDPYKDAE